MDKRYEIVIWEIRRLPLLNSMEAHLRLGALISTENAQQGWLVFSSMFSAMWVQVQSGQEWYLVGLRFCLSVSIMLMCH